MGFDAPRLLHGGSRLKTPPSTLQIESFTAREARLDSDAIGTSKIYVGLFCLYFSDFCLFFKANSPFFLPAMTLPDQQRRFVFVAFDAKL